VREIRTLRAMWRELETELREKTSPRYRASSRPYQHLVTQPVDSSSELIFGDRHYGRTESPNDRWEAAAGNCSIM